MKIFSPNNLALFLILFAVLLILQLLGMELLLLKEAVIHRIY